MKNAVLSFFIFGIYVFVGLLGCKVKKSKTKENTITTFSQKDITSTTLREAYKNYFPVGTAIYYDILAKAPERLRIICTQYSSITPEVEMKPKQIHPTENYFDFAKADSLVAFAVRNNMKVRGHCLIWFWDMPEWFFYENGKEVSKSTLLKRMDVHITTIMRHFSGKVYCWDVVNEVVSSEKGLTFSKLDRLYKILGEQYIEEAFKIARRVEPSAKLYYNDSFNAEGKKEKIFHLLKRLKEKGVPIDGIGIQGHYGLNSFTEKSLREDIALFKSIGLEIQFTEVDIAIFDRVEKRYILTDRSLSKEIAAKQAKQYEILFRVCREEPGVKGITLWGAADWPNFLNKELKRDAYPYLFTAEMKPKDAFWLITNFSK